MAKHSLCKLLLGTLCRVISILGSVLPSRRNLNLFYVPAGFPSVGKSTLLTKLTGTLSEVSVAAKSW